MKIKLRWNLVLASQDATDDGRRRFRQIKKRLRRMTQDELSVLILNAVDKSLDSDRAIGFRRHIE